MARLDALLNATDLDELLRLRHEIPALTPEESDRVAAVIREWRDRQAVSNLLFYPELIPAGIRFEALDRALHSSEDPYVALAASVGLQRVAPDDVPSEKREAWILTLLTHAGSTSPVLARRASMTLGSWSRRATDTDVLQRLVSRYPMAVENASRNIIAAVLDRCGDLGADEFDQRLSDWRVSEPARAALRAAHAEYSEMKSRDGFRATLMKAPVLAYIPNLSESERPSMLVADAQREVRTVFVGGFIGTVVSSALWALSAAASTWIATRYGILVLVFGGPLIFPITQLVLRGMGRRASLSPNNPMSHLAMQVAFTIPLNLLVVGGATLYRLNWFYPGCAIVVGAHYLPFVHLYGMWQFGILGAVLVAVGVLIGLYVPGSFSMGGWITAGILLVFAFLARAVARGEERRTGN
jgi:uncharacterized protein DUF7010